ncbi:uncharacterized protein K460DRAFT_403124 [Cucurbitaria berberidis CBS 394.84]|uniref:Uncharacterized protein n=1 Tax=Cucurbitaria berberidis CBS 394.84 TaxID=1168544 RepID=A0A9P4GM13_9PLEO|nr:uncharacterized protein K460DRAFT_403124 [Cucurbitaria berberidis CBS 394.84]KAF1847801.1 hypothetical protein K460DRAFT_403124 [Cucurbitaria berberidis CBS 394.84]
MPFFVRPSKTICRNFMRRPAAQVCRFPSGHDFYFSLPIEVNCLHLFNPFELEFFFGFLSNILPSIAKRKGRTGVDNALHIQHTILRRLQKSKNLSSSQMKAWVAGYGLPIFDDAQELVDFIVDWDSIEFEGNLGSTERKARKRAEENGLDPCGPVPVCPKDIDNDVVLVFDWGKDGNEAFEVRRNGETELFCIYGGIFQNKMQWTAYETSLSEQVLKLLRAGVLRVTTLPTGGWGLIEGLHEQHSNDSYSGRIDEQLNDLSTFESSASHSSPCTNSALCSAGTLRCTTRDVLDIHANNSKNIERNKRSPSMAFQQSVNVFGATFRNWDDWIQFKHTLTRVDLDLLSHRVLQLRRSNDGRITITQGPNAGPPSKPPNKDAHAPIYSQVVAPKQCVTQRSPQDMIDRKQFTRGVRQFSPPQRVGRQAPSLEDGIHRNSISEDRAASCNQSYPQPIFVPLPTFSFLATQKGGLDADVTKIPATQRSRRLAAHKEPVRPKFKMPSSKTTYVPDEHRVINIASSTLARSELSSPVQPLSKATPGRASSPLRNKLAAPRTTMHNCERYPASKDRNHSKYQAYATSSSDTSPQASPFSWRDV